MNKRAAAGIFLITFLFLAAQAGKAILPARAASSNLAIGMVTATQGSAVTTSAENLPPGNLFNVIMGPYSTQSNVALPLIAWAPTPGDPSTPPFMEAATGQGIGINLPFIALPAPLPVVFAPAPAGERIGLIPGHTGANPQGVNIDPGAVCPDGLTEQSVNYKIASLVKQDLEKTGYTVELLDEHDPRLDGYKGLLLLSIHNDSCDNINPQATGFKVAANLYNDAAEPSTRLAGCLINRYRKDTGLRFDFTSITPAMTRYHAFFEIDPKTPSAIIEAGFLYLDRKFLTRHTDRVASGITDGILCYLRNEYVGSIQP